MNRSEYLHLSSQINALSSNLNRLIEDKSWVVSKEFHPDTEKSTSEDIYLDIVWSFRELERGSNVYLEYSSDGKEWVEVEAEMISGTTYKASLKRRSCQRL